jgi:hypothetical protein
MNDTQYDATRTALMSICQQLAALDLAGMERRIETCEGIGPLIDPTKYRTLMSRGGREALDRDKKIIRAARDLAKLYLPDGTGGPRWEKAISHARERLAIGKEIGPAGAFYVASVSVLIRRYEGGDRSDELLTEMEGLE